MNKYQEALKKIDELEGMYYEDEIKTLQELIDNYEKLEQENKAYKYLFKEDTADKNNANIEKVSVYYENKRLDKALDKACKELAKLEKLFLDAGGYEEFGCKEERWKEWLLNE